ncbi:MAG: metallophosphoesterase [Planctomycetes bacterium]|nr:metallophosphoesterase [Planctomycetota bacterium]
MTKIQTVNMSDPIAASEILLQAAVVMENAKGRIGATQHIPSTGKILITGDLHDNPFNYSKIIKLAELDQNEDNHLVLQELIHSDKLINGVDMSYRMLIRIAALIVAYPTQVHPILANHELSQLTRRGITKGKGNIVELFIDGVEWVFGNESDCVFEAVDAFFLAMPLAVKSASGLMCCHSLPNAPLMHVFDIDVLNRPLTGADRNNFDGSATLMVWGRVHTETQVCALAKAWDVKLFCLGHAFVPDGIEMLMPNVLLLNSDHEQGAVLPIDLSDIPTAETAMWSAIKLASLPHVPDHA